MRTSVIVVLVLTQFLIGAAICILGIVNIDTNIEDVMQWLPDHSRERTLYEGLVAQFGVDDFLVASWDGCTTDDPRLKQVEERLIEEDADGLIAKTTSGADLIENGSEYESADAIRNRFRGIFFGDDDQTCIAIILTKAGMTNRLKAVEYVDRVVRAGVGPDQSGVLIVGYPAISAEGDRLIRQNLTNALLPCCLLSTIAAWFFLRDLRLVLAVFITSGIAAGTSIAFVTLSGHKWGGLTSAIPALTFILTVSGTLHLVNYARGADHDQIAQTALRLGWKPCLFSAITTAVSMLSLSHSEYQAIREFGLFCAIGVVNSVFWQLAFAPWALQLIARTISIARAGTSLVHMHDWTATHPVFVFGVFMATLVVTASGLPKLESGLEVEEMFGTHTLAIQDVMKFERKIGPIDQTELLVEFAKPDPAQFADRAAAIRELQRGLEGSPEVDATMSAAAWLPPEPETRGIAGVSARVVYRRKLASLRDELADTSYLSLQKNEEGEEAETWRISLRFPFARNVDFAELRDAVAIATEAELAKHYSPSEFGVEQTGVGLLYHVAQSKLMADLFYNYLLAFAVICPLMILVLRSLTLGVLSMIPNCFPAICLYGAIGLYGQAIDIGIAIAGCIALGIAVDDTTHFMLRAEEISSRDGKQGRIKYSAIRTAYSQCSRAMLATTSIAAIGLAAFLNQTLLVMARFSLVLILSLLIALICDLLLLPALLYTFPVTERDEPEDVS
ncbi:MMPL family transporter [Blastopirellula sp. JC732]|uniref:MMPL family transporter n=1 Tax=Blastopirellula sediminis TaxID=2894196 RepID=A0A9X1MN52_9BACT|nr:MMPL family transporter [Blastopirellula sediminis]MCC9606429.1 MMPL family transporter [Blastopirellula sediminis]MCC9630273.1 MMPL family transporter [Blastopirellula sediminis]